MKNYIFAFFCAIFLAQALIINAKPQTDDYQVAERREVADVAEIRDAADAAEKIFKELMAAIDKALTDASNSLNAAVEAVNETVIELEAKAQDTIALAMDPINEKLKDLIAQAESLGLNTTKCENYVDDLTNLPHNLLNDMVACMTKQLYKATSYVDDVIKNIKVIEQDMAKFKDQIEACQGNIWTEVECLAILVAKMTKDAVEVPVKITADVSKTVILIKALIPTVTLCYDTCLANVPIEGLKIVGKFALCVGLQ